MLSIKSVSALGHYTDWIIGHVHGGALGWNGFMTFGILYWLWPRLYGTKLYSTKLAEAHFWIGTIAILMYVVSMWVSGVSQGLFWRALDAEGYLKYPDFIEGLTNSTAMYHTRLLGGTLFFLSSFLLVFNLIMTARQGKPVTVSVQVPVKREGPDGESAWALLTSAPMLFIVGILVLAIWFGAVRRHGQSGAAGPADRRLRGRHHLLRPASEAVGPLVRPGRTPRPGLHRPGPGGHPDRRRGGDHSHRHCQQQHAPGDHRRDDRRESRSGRDRQVAAETLHARWSWPAVTSTSAEGCYACHSQMIRPFRHEVLRYGDYSRLEESLLDHPFQWGSKRTGLDLARVGGKYDNLWHYLHLMDPRSTSPASEHAQYDHFKTQTLDPAVIAGRMRALRILGAPYTEEDIALAEQRFLSQGQMIADDLAGKDVNIAPDSKMAAMIAYLQRLGRGPQPVSRLKADRPSRPEIGRLNDVPGVFRQERSAGLASGWPAHLRGDFRRRAGLVFLRSARQGQDRRDRVIAA